MNWYATIKRYYDKGFYTLNQMRIFVEARKITEEQYDGCVSMVKVDYSKFDYDYIFNNNYDNKSLEDILDVFKYTENM